MWVSITISPTPSTQPFLPHEFFPNLAGFGNVHSLHQAMALDTSGELQDLVEQVISASGAERVF
jgi:hypothetical protein